VTEDKQNKIGKDNTNTRGTLIGDYRRMKRRPCHGTTRTGGNISG
jgi:hypothetical protein